MRLYFFLPVLLIVAGCGGGGGSAPTPPVYPVAGMYYGTVVSSANNSGNMGFTTDGAGNGNFAVQYPGEAALQETFAPPISRVNGNSIAVNDTLDGCVFSLNATTTASDTLKGSYSLTCSGTASASATFNLPVGTYSISSNARKMKP